MVYEFSRVADNRALGPVVLFKNPDNQTELGVYINEFMQGKYPECESLLEREKLKAVISVMEKNTPALAL